MTDPSLAPRSANYVPLSPLSFLQRTADIYPDRIALIDDDLRLTWAQVRQHCTGLAAGLRAQGLQPGDVVSVLAPNTAAMFCAHFGVPMAGAVLNTINIRLDPETVAYILGHADTKVLLIDRQYASLATAALARLDGPKPLLVDMGGPGAAIVGAIPYDALIATPAVPTPAFPQDEWDTITLNDTSGTSGAPKGVLYHHRGAYLIALGTLAGWHLSGHPTYLYTVPMFHCNGWGHVWTMTALAATVVCCRQVTAHAIYDAITRHGVTHFGGAPIVLGMLVDAAAASPPHLPHTVQVMTAGFNVMQVYGLTETCGHVVQSLWQDAWDGLDVGHRATLKARQGGALSDGRNGRHSRPRNEPPAAPERRCNG